MRSKTRDWLKVLLFLKLMFVEKELFLSLENSIELMVNKFCFFSKYFFNFSILRKNLIHS